MSKGPFPCLLVVSIHPHESGRVAWTPTAQPDSRHDRVFFTRLATHTHKSYTHWQMTIMRRVTALHLSQRRQQQFSTITALFSSISRTELRSPNERDAAIFQELMGERNGCVITNPIEAERYNRDWTVSNERAPVF